MIAHGEPAASFEEGLSVREVVSILFLRKWTILWVLLATVATAAVLVYYVITPSYLAEAIVIMNPNYQVGPTVEYNNRSDLEKLTAFHTQKDVISSATIAAMVVDKLHLGDHRVLSRVEKWQILLRSGRRRVGFWFGIKSWQKPEDYRALAVKAVLANFELVSRGDSLALKLSYQAHDGKEAAETLRTLIDEWRAFYYDLERSRALGLSEYLEDRLLSVRKDLSVTEAQFLRLKQGDTVGVEGSAAAASKGRIGQSTLAEITDSGEARSDMRAYILGMEEELRKLRAQYTDSHPAVLALREKITRFVETLNAVPQKQLQLLRLSRDLDLHQKALVLIRENLERARMVEAGDISKLNVVKVVGYPVAPDDPKSPSKKTTMAVAVIFGLLLGMIWAVALDYLDHSIKSSRDMERFLHLRVIASLKEIA